MQTPITDSMSRMTVPELGEFVPIEDARKLEIKLVETRKEAAHWKAQCQRGFNVSTLIEQRERLAYYSRRLDWILSHCKIEALENVAGDLERYEVETIRDAIDQEIIFMETYELSKE